MEYNLTNTKNPSFGIVSNESSFVYVERRIGQITKSFIEETVISHIQHLNDLKTEKGLKGYLQLRSLYFNDKGGDYKCTIHYLTDSSYENKPDLSFENPIWVIEGQPTYVEFKIIDCLFSSDHFDKNHRDYYSKISMF